METYGKKEWYIVGVEYTEEEFNEKIKQLDPDVINIDGKLISKSTIKEALKNYIKF